MALPEFRTRRSTRGPKTRSKALSSDVATKISHTCRDSNEITVAAWLTPTLPVQRGPAVIASIAKDSQTRLFTLGQGTSDGQPASSYTALLQTSETGPGGAPLEVAVTRRP